MAIDPGRATEIMRSLWFDERNFLITAAKNCIDARERFEERRRQALKSRRRKGLFGKHD